MAKTSVPLNEPSSRTTSLRISTSNVLIWSKFRVYKNLFCISTSIFLLFTGFSGVGNLQSTINSQEGMGLASQAIGYVLFCISSLLLPEITIRKLGCKVVLVICIIGYFPYVVSNFHPKWETLTLSAALSGLFASLLWPSSCKYLNNLSILYKGQTDRANLASTSSIFFGISDMFFFLAGTSGNLLSYFILEDPKSSLLNVSHIRCGTTFVDDDIFTKNNTNLVELNKDLRNILIGVYSGCSLLSIVPILLILDHLPKNYDKVEKRSLFYKLTATLSMMKRKRQLLLMPFSLYYGMQHGFYIGDFTRIYVACALGVYHIGLVAMCQSVSAGLCSSLFGRLRKYTGRIPMYAMAALANIVVFIQLFLWIPHPEKPFILFITAVMWGIFHGIYYTQIRAFYGDLFRGEEETAFASYYVLSSMGRILSFSYSKYLFITTKLYLLVLVFCLAQVGYLILEWDIRNCQRSDDHIPKNQVTVPLAHAKGEENTAL